MPKSSPVFELMHLLRLSLMRGRSVQASLLWTLPELADPLHAEILLTLRQHRVGAGMNESIYEWEKRTTHFGLKMLVRTLRSIDFEETKFNSSLDPAKALDPLFHLDLEPYELTSETNPSYDENEDFIEPTPERATEFISHLKNSSRGLLLGGCATEKDVERARSEFSVNCMLKPGHIDIHQCENLIQNFPLILELGKNHLGKLFVKNAQEIFGFRSGHALYQDIFTYHEAGFRDGGHFGFCHGEQLVPHFVTKLEKEGQQIPRHHYSQPYLFEPLFLR